MNFWKSLLSDNYMTVMLLTAFFFLQIINRTFRHRSVRLFAAAVVLTFGIAFLDQLEIWCDSYQKPVWILYVKSALVYMIYPVILLMEALVTLPIKKRLLLILPLIPYGILLCLNAFGIELMYGYYANHQFRGGPLRFLPTVMILFYELVITGAAVRMVRSGAKQRGTVLLFIACITAATVILELFSVVQGYTDEIAAMGLLVYFWYIAADYQSRVKEQLYQSRLEAERSKNEMLMAQIQPHFINNSLMAIRARCRNYPEVYDSITRFSKYLRTHFDMLGDSQMIPFEQEMENVEAYLDLERDNFGERLQVEYDIECDQFLVPALSVQPLVENAVRHGIGTYEQGGTVLISARKTEGGICIEITDDGSGVSSITQQQKKRKGIGIENVRARLRSMGGGELEILTGEHGTTARITLHEEGGNA